MSKIDTQGMSAPMDPNYKGPIRAQKHKPMEIHPRRLFTPEMVKEAKILINEVLDEREHKKEWQEHMIMWNLYHHHTLIQNILNIVSMNLNHPIKIGANK